MKKKIFTRFNALGMRGLVVGLMLLVGVTAFGQTTVFTDDFNRGSVVSPLSNGGTPTMTYTTTSTASTAGTSTTNQTSGSDYTVSLACNSTTAAAGRTYVYGALSTFSSPFNTTLSSNVGLVTWSFNLRTNRSTALSGFDASQYVDAVVLVCNNSDFLNSTAKGYLVYMNKGVTNNKINLGSFTTGLSLSSGVTSVIGPSTELASNSNFVSVKVTYNPSTNTWSLYVRDDASSTVPGDPTTTSTQVGSSVVNSVNTSVAMTHFGYFWNHSNGAASTNSGRFDNFKVVVNNPIIATPSSTALTGFNYGVGSGPSGEQSFTISAQYLSANLTLTPPTNYEISTGTGGSFAATNPISITPTSGTVASTTIYVRLKAGLSSGNYNSENITIASTNATSRTVACSGSVTSTPTITSSTASLTAFANTAAGANSASSNFTVSGSNLTADIALTAPTNFEVSLDNSTFSSSVNITPSSGSVSSVTVYARYSPSGSGGYSGNITATSTGATNQTIAVSGYLSAFYYQSGSLATNTNWSGTANGSGTSVPDVAFSTAGVSYIILTSTTTTAAWTVAGTGSKIVVGDPSVAAVTLTVASGFPITTTSPAVLDIVAASSGANSVIFQDAVTPTLGTLNAASEVHYQATLSTGTTKTFGKLFVDGSGTTTTFTGTPGIQTTLTVASGATMATGNNSGNYVTINSGASVAINGTFQTQKVLGFVSSNVVTAGSIFATLQFIGAESLTLGAASTIGFIRASSGTAQTIDARTDYANLTISGLDNNKNFAAGTLAVSGALTIGVTGTSVLSQPSATTINYTVSSAQTMPSAITTYSNLGISGGGTKTASANIAVTGNLTLAASTILDMNGSSLTIGSGSSGSMVKGTGTIKGNFTHASGSTLAPGASPGTVTIDGTLTNIGDWAIEIGGATPGSGYDRVVVSGAATLTSGTVTVSLLSYDPPVGTSFVILSAASVTGTFTAINLPTLTGGKTWATPVYSANSVTISVNAVLPIELSNFQVKSNQKSALLSWTTASEKDNAAFNIEQSTNGTDFQTVGQVKGQGTTAATTAYNFEHTTPSVGINYYRLKQVDFNGSATYSGVKSIVFGKTDLVIKNTLVHDALDIITNEDTATPLSIFNVSGQQVFNTKAQGTQRIDVSALPVGLYVVRTATGEVGRFVKH